MPLYATAILASTLDPPLPCRLLPAALLYLLSYFYQHCYNSLIILQKLTWKLGWLCLLITDNHQCNSNRVYGERIKNINMSPIADKLTFHVMLQLDKIHSSQRSFCVIR